MLTKKARSFDDDQFSDEEIIGKYSESVDEQEQYRKVIFFCIKMY